MRTLESSEKDFEVDELSVSKHNVVTAKQRLRLLSVNFNLERSSVDWDIFHVNLIKTSSSVGTFRIRRCKVCSKCRNEVTEFFAWVLLNSFSLTACVDWLVTEMSSKGVLSFLQFTALLRNFLYKFSNLFRIISPLFRFKCYYLLN